MNKTLLTAALAALLAAGPALAADEAEAAVEAKYVIALSTDDFELAETDVSHLAVGESQTIVTDSGKTIDVLRTDRGVEIYVDGELLDIPAAGDGHVVHERFEIVCDGDEDCEELTWATANGEVDLEALEADGAHQVIMIRKEVDATGAGIDVDVEVDAEGAEHGEKVIVIRRKKVADEI